MRTSNDEEQKQDPVDNITNGGLVGDIHPPYK
jgi:hypothetical protein